MFLPHQSFTASDDGTVQAAQYQLDEFRFVDDMFHNRELELWNADNGNLLGRSDPYVPVNMRSAPRERVMEIQSALESEYRARVERPSTPAPPESRSEPAGV